jgi:hypothetical protein
LRPRARSSIHASSVPHVCMAVCMAVCMVCSLSGFHWDRDEVLADNAASTMVHPNVATVTYLTNTGAPTMVVRSHANAMSFLFVRDLRTTEPLLFELDDRYSADRRMPHKRMLHRRMLHRRMLHRRMLRRRILHRRMLRRRRMLHRRILLLLLDGIL